VREHPADPTRSLDKHHARSIPTRGHCCSDAGRRRAVNQNIELLSLRSALKNKTDEQKKKKMNPSAHAAKFVEWQLCVKTLLARGKRLLARVKNEASAMRTMTTAATDPGAPFSTLGHRQSHRHALKFHDATTPHCAISKLNCMNPTCSPALHLAYCQNIHPGETWEQHFLALSEKAVAVKAALQSDGLLAPEAPFGLGLRLSAYAAKELQAEASIQQGNTLFKAAGLYPFSINGFPFGKFHQGPVKENVYAPDWRSADRLQYTTDLANALAAWLPVGGSGSISTVPGSYAAWIKDKEDALQMARTLGHAVAHLASLERTTGRHVHLGLEPEPDCFLETTLQTLEFFQNTLPEGALPILKATLGVNQITALELLHRHLGVCFDTCHVALQFEEPADALRAYRDAGILISKIQLSAALRTKASQEAIVALAAFQEPTYLHQVKARNEDGAILSWPDLPAALAELPSTAAALNELRVHFHVPLFIEPTTPLASTADTLTPEFWELVRSGICPHLEIETYTFDVLPPEVHPGDIIRSIAEEYRWVLKHLADENAGSESL